MKYSMKCTCGDVMTVDADSKEKAIEMLKGMMTEEAVKKHFDEKHPGEEVPSQEQVGLNIEQTVQEGVIAGTEQQESQL